ncbi:HAD family hydrolase [Corynebacterium tapiri]|uniref:HAD family hydrolase n=1 Tax=Corynebacterium tapiri TaxID=1448266 RepID=UPI002482401E|nr:HAD family hydrolase [Corynebacterium tapiri]
MRIVALDMDGTLLDAAGAIPPGFWDVKRRAEERGWIIAPASGRQLATLENTFAAEPPRAFIAENGTVVSIGGEIVSTTTVPAAEVSAALARATQIEAAVVVCSPTVAFIQRGLPASTRAEIDKYYHSVEEVDDVYACSPEGVIKLAFFGEAEAVIAPALRECVDQATVVVSGAQWVDIMHPEANKGVALHQLAVALDFDLADTVAFGDYLNDYELLRTAGTAYAMENAHPQLKEIADAIAPANTEYGVVTELNKLLED